VLRQPTIAAVELAGLMQGIAEAHTWAQSARSIAGDFGNGGLERALTLAHLVGARLPALGEGDTITVFEALATVAAADLSVARVIEPHLEALAVLRQAEDEGRSPIHRDPASTWGVFAAEGSGLRVDARVGERGWTLTGTKPWCSLPGVLSHAIVTAFVGEKRQAFAVGLRGEGVRVEDVEWPSRGLAPITSGPVTFDQAPAIPVGGPNWYASRPGVAWREIAVAAIWYGGAVGVARRLAEAAQRRAFDQIGNMHLGNVDMLLHAGRAVLAEAAAQIDAGDAVGVDGRVLALRVRGVVARVADAIVDEANRGMGPAPLALEEEHARRVADLMVYVRQEHAARDAAVLGALLTEQVGRHRP